MNSTVYKADVLVIGGGVSGVIASVCAAEKGASVILLEKESYLGGISVGSMMGQFVGCGLNSVPMFGGKSKELIDSLFEENAAIYHEMPMRTKKGNILLLRYNVEVLCRKLEEMAVAAGVRIFYNSQVVSTIEQKESCYVEAIGINSKLYFESSYMIDATGCAAVVNLAGFPTINPPVAKRMPSALIFKVGGADIEKVNQFDWVKVRKEWFKSGILPSEHLALAPVPNTNEVIINATNISPVDEESTEDVTRAIIALQKQIQDMFPFFKENIPGLEHSYITSIGRMLGVRETRRILGEEILTTDDIMNGRTYNDAIAIGAWPIDRNLPDGGNLWIETDKPYQIPYGVLIPKGSERILVAGRSISTDDDTYSATRVIPTTMTIGEAVGEAAGLALKTKTTFNKLDVQELSKILKNKGIKLDW